MTEVIRRTFPKKPAPGTPFKSPIAKFKKDQERWENERKEMQRNKKNEEHSSQATERFDESLVLNNDSGLKPLRKWSIL